MADTNISYLRAYLRGCTALSSSKFFRVNYIDDDPECYAIFTEPSTIRYTTDITGDTYPNPIQELNYYFVVSMDWGKDIRQNMDSLNLLNSVISWLYSQNSAKNFPTMTDGNVISIMPTLSPYPTAQSDTTALYKIQLKLRYRRK